MDLHPARPEDVLTIETDDGGVFGVSSLLLARLNDVVWKAKENSYGAALPKMTQAFMRIQRLSKRKSH